MKNIISLLALFIVVVGLAGCLDPQDGSNGRPQSSLQLDLK